MTVVATGLQVKRFFAEHPLFAAGAYDEHTVITVDGDDTGYTYDHTALPDEGVVRVSEGRLYNRDGLAIGTVEALLLRWLSSRPLVSVQVALPAEAHAGLMHYVANCRGEAQAVAP